MWCFWKAGFSGNEGFEKRYMSYLAKKGEILPGQLEKSEV
jgi:hypothetical protein